jgi:hypothetical protein
MDADIKINMKYLGHYAVVSAAVWFLSSYISRGEIKNYKKEYERTSHFHVTDEIKE